MSTMIVWLLVGYSSAYSSAPTTLATLPDLANCRYVAEQLKDSTSAIRTRCVKAQIVVMK